MSIDEKFNFHEKVQKISEMNSYQWEEKKKNLILLL